MQEPALIGVLAILFFAIGLNLIGAFDIGGSAQNLGAGVAAKGGDVGAFATGALAVVAATPCTAPFMAGALGYAFAAPVPSAMLVFLVLGLGLATPFLLIGFVPALASRIPKPGAWMERAKNVLAFPMFGAAVWLVWVLAAQTGADGVAALLWLFLAVSFAILASRWGRVWLVIGVLALAVTGACVWRPLLGVEAREAGAIGNGRGTRRGVLREGAGEEEVPGFQPYPERGQLVGEPHDPHGGMPEHPGRHAPHRRNPHVRLRALLRLSCALLPVLPLSRSLPLRPHPLAPPA